MKKVLTIFLVSLFSVAMLAGCGSSTSTPADTKPEEKQESIYGLGERVVIENNGEEIAITINSVMPTDERNPYTDKQPAQVVVVNYTYENISYSGELLVSDMLNLKAIDSAGTVADSYPASSMDFFPQGVPQGANYTAQASFGLANVGNTLKITYTPTFSDKALATWEIAY